LDAINAYQVYAARVVQIAPKSDRGFIRTSANEAGPAPHCDPLSDVGYAEARIDRMWFIARQ
jgi:hypothetical protein